MAKAKEPAITPTQAINEYYGGIKELNKQSMPFTCNVCGKSTFPGVDPKGKAADMPVMNIQDAFTHVRKVHRERIANLKDVTDKK